MFQRLFKSRCVASAVGCLVTLLGGATAAGQSVGLPAPRLLTTMPMGGQAGTTVEVTITGQSLDTAEALLFSHPEITAKQKRQDNGERVANQFVIQISEDCQPGVYDARVMTGMGLSTARAFSVSKHPEVTQSEACTTVQTAMPIAIGSIVNGTLVDRSINHYAIEASKGQRILIDCASKGIDSKMNPVVAVADASGSDLIVERRGGVIDFTIPASGRYLIKVHDLTFKGGPYYFYRLAVMPWDGQGTPPRMPSTHHVASFSWPPPGLAAGAAKPEAEPNDSLAESQPIELPCDIEGRFFPAADVDSFEFTAQKGETWWVEVASERLGHPTDPVAIVQQIRDDGTLVDVAELTDIPSPVKRSSNGYSYDGPPYNAGSSDINGKVEIPEDGKYRIRLSDLFGGTRTDPTNRYRLIVRQAAPDFSLVGWALHMGLRNGDRNALSKPMALRRGAVMPLEVVVVRRDGFDGEIELTMENLPEGVTATGLKIAAGATRGIVLVAADPNAPRGLTFASLSGRATIDGEQVVRDCRLASMKWPVPNAKAEIPDPRLVDQIPVSVNEVETAGLSIDVAEDKVWEVQQGQTLRLPLTLTRRSEFSGTSMSLKTFGAGFERNAAFDFSLADDQTQAVIDLAKLKPAPGDYTIAFYGGAVAKYRSGDAKPKDIVDIYVSQPIQIRVVPAKVNTP